MDVGNREFFAQITKGVNALLLLFVFALLLAMSGLGWTTYYLAVNKSRTITPPTIGKPFVISDVSVSEEYLEMMAEYFAYLRFNVTPLSVEKKFHMLAEYADERSWAKFAPVLSKEISFIKDHNVSSAFDVHGRVTDVDNLAVRLTGNLHKSVGIRPLPVETNSYIVKMSYQHGFLQLDYINKEPSKEEEL